MRKRTFPGTSRKAPDTCSRIRCGSGRRRGSRSTSHKKKGFRIRDSGFGAAKQVLRGSGFQAGAWEPGTGVHFLSTLNSRLSTLHMAEEPLIAVFIDFENLAI